MENVEFENENGLKLVISNKENKDTHVIMGGDSSNPSWDEYLSEYKKEYQPHILLIRKAIEEMGWIGEMASDKANNTEFIFSDGIGFGFTWRAWGDLMQAIVNKKEGYMTYYM